MVILSCVDAFANRAGTGNPAGFCLLHEPKDASWMQMVAREMNLSETAFLLMEKDGFSLQWFTPVTISRSFAGMRPLLLPMSSGNGDTWNRQKLPASLQKAVH